MGAVILLFFSCLTVGTGAIVAQDKTPSPKAQIGVWLLALLIFAILGACIL